MDAVVSIPGAEPWSAPGDAIRGRTGIIVTHGFTGNPLGTRPLGQRLAAEGYTVEVPLLPGHGTNHRDLGRTRYADWVQTVENVLDHLLEGCDQVVLIGHSVGGMITLDIASRRPDDVAAVVVINPVVLNPVQPLAKVAFILQYLLPYVPRDLAGVPSNDIAMPGLEEGAYKMLSAKAAQSYITELPRVRAQLLDLVQPLLVVRSTVDHTVSPDNSVELLQLVGSSDIRECVCERSFHLPQLDYDAERVEEAVVAFVAEFAGG